MNIIANCRIAKQKLVQAHVTLAARVHQSGKYRMMMSSESNIMLMTDDRHLVVSQAPVRSTV